MISALLGGILIGAAASLFWLANGRVAGVSGILHGAVHGGPGGRDVRVAFLLGLVLSGVVLGAGHGAAQPTASAATVAAGGLLAGFGARLGGGCTSGHGVCGISRLSVRSLVATVTFIAAGAATVLVVRHILPHLGQGG